MTSASALQSRQSIRFRGRSFVAFVLAPAAPLTDWLGELDRWTKTSPDFFSGRPTILDLAALTIDSNGIVRLLAILAERGIRIVGLEGVDPVHLAPSLPPLLKGGRPASGSDEQARGPTDPPQGGQGARPEPTSLLIENPIRSGQSVVFPYGDITVLGAVSSGAELVAAGSIHVYGALRGRVMAGAMGNNSRARIFCSRNDAELIAIDGFYRTAEEMDPALRGRPVQCLLKDRTLSITALN